METEPRPFAGILDETYCPEDQKVGCESCDGESECIIRAHEEFKCGQLELHGLPCEICDKMKEGE